MPADLRIVDVPSTGHDEWRSVISMAPEGSPYQLPEYLSALAAATDSEFRLLGAYRDKELVGGIGLYLRHTGWGVDATSRLLLYYNGPFVKPSLARQPHKQEQHRRSVHRALASHLESAGYRRVRFKTRQPLLDYRGFLESGWQARPVYSYVVNLHDMDQLWQDMDNNLRRLVRRCQQTGMEFTNQGSFDAFWEMHAQLEQKVGATLYLPRARFAQFVDDLSREGLATLFQVTTSDGVPAATQLVLHRKHPVAHTLSAGCAPGEMQSGCNAFLRWRVFQWLSEHGYQALDLTDAHQSSVAHFKSQLGAEVQLGLQIEWPDHWATATAERTWQLGHRLQSKVGRLLRRERS